MSKEILIGIYSITNLISNKRYIGQSINIYDRWYNHKYLLEHNNHPNDYLQKSWNKYGANSFKFEILELCDEKLLDELESNYITLFNTIDKDFGYNLNDGGNSNKHLSEETKNKIRKAHLGRHASEETRKKISSNRKGKTAGKNHPNFGKKMSEEHLELLRNLAKSRNKENSWQAKKVICINNLEIFPTIKEAAIKYREYGVSSANISKCCKGNRRYCGRFEDGTPIQWDFYEENKEYILKENVDEIIKPNIKPIIQYDLDYNYISTYESAREAEKITGIGHKLISKVCRGERKQTHGFIFEFL